MARRKGGKRRPPKRVETERYTDDDGNALVLRKALSPATIAKINTEAPATDAATIDDAWQRREELIFERLVQSWEIAGLEPLTDQRLLLGRFRMASPTEREWVRRTVREHAERWIPGI